MFFIAYDKLIVYEFHIGSVYIMLSYRNLFYDLWDGNISVIAFPSHPKNLKISRKLTSKQDTSLRTKRLPKATSISDTA